MLNQKVAEHQQDPTQNNLPCIQDLVIQDIIARKEVGKERYGTYLQPFNGRSALMDAYQEALDLCQYLRQMLYEEEHPTHYLRTNQTQFCEHCGPVKVAYMRDGTSWCEACFQAEGWEIPECL
jgi:hypothetical protein